MTIIVFTAGILEKQPTLRQLLDYKNQIGSKWYDLGKILLGEKIVNEILKKKHPPNKQCSQILRAWVEEQNHTWRRFIDALKKADRIDVANEISQKLYGMNICMHMHTYIYMCIIL